MKRAVHFCGVVVPWPTHLQLSEHTGPTDPLVGADSGNDIFVQHLGTKLWPLRVWGESEHQVQAEHWQAGAPTVSCTGAGHSETDVW